MPDCKGEFLNVYHGEGAMHYGGEEKNCCECLQSMFLVLVDSFLGNKVPSRCSAQLVLKRWALEFGRFIEFTNCSSLV